MLQNAPLDEEQLKDVAIKVSQTNQSSNLKPTDTRGTIGKLATKSTNVSSIDWTISEDFDLSSVKTKRPPPRQSVEPTYRGWKEVGGWEEKDALTLEDESVDLLSKASIFDTYLPSVAFGDWYHNVGYIILSGFLSWIMGWFRFSLAPIFFIMVIFCILYRTSVRKYRTLLRKQAQREFSIKSIENDYETIDWLNTFLEKFWFFLEPSVSQIVCDIANPILASSPAPAFIKQLWIDSFTAGTKPPRIDTVKTVSGTAEDIVVMDWGCSFTPNSLVDSNNKQMKNNVNQKVVVKADIFGFPVAVAVSDVSFKALVRVRLRMMSSFPHVQTVNLTLLEPPQIDFTSKVLGDTIFNWEVLAFPGLFPFINEMIKKYVGAMLFNPMSFQINLQQIMAGHPFGSAVGVLQIRAKYAKGIINFQYRGNTMDPYLTFGFGNHVLGKTKYKPDTSEPVWNETLYIPVTTLSEPLNITVWDKNHKRKDRPAGSIQMDLESLIKTPKQTDIVHHFLRNNKPIGKLFFDLNYLPTLEAERQPDGAVIPPPDLNTGIARIAVNLARNLKPKDEKKPFSTYAELHINNKLLLTTSKVKKNNSPAWNSSHEEIIYNRAKTKVRIYIKNADDDKIIGKISTSLNEFIDASQVDETWFPLAKGGEVLISTSWKPVALVGASGAGGYTPPIGVVRISIEKAEDLRNLETIGKIDPYTRVLVNGFERARTAALDSNLNPTWNEIHYATVSSPNQKLTLEVMDVESHSPDRTLGSFDVKLNEIINKNERGQYIEHIDDEVREGRLIHRKGPKGSLTYSLSFYPCLPIMTLEEIKDEEEERKRIEKEREEKKKKEEKEGKKEDKKSDKKESKAEEEDDDEDDEHATHKLKLGLEELIEYKSGVITYEIIDGEIAKDGTYLQVFFDNHGFSDYVSQKLRGKNPKVGVTGDSVIKELDWSQACFRLTKDKDDNRAEKVLAETTIPTIQLVQNGFKEPYTVHLNGSSNASFKIRFSWIPVIYETGIPPQDSYTNSGHVTVEVVRAEGLKAADRNGKSDPYVELHLNTNKDEFMKTKKVKKSLEPVWNEKGTVSVSNRYDSNIRVVCFDWDMGPEKDDLLGISNVSLSDVPTTGETVELTAPLIDEDGTDAGVVYLKASFKPDFVLNVRPGSSTNIGDAFGHVGSGVGHVGKGLGKGVGKGVGGVGKVFKKGLHLGKSSD